MKLINTIVLLLIIVVSTGCDKAKSLTNSDVSIVKNGTLEFDKSITVGQAIDKYRYFTKTDWESMKEENGRRIVQTTAQIDITKYPEVNKIKIPDLKSAFFKFQFVINQDKTFQIGWCGFGAEMNAGKKIEPDKTVNLLQCMNTLREIYANEVGEVPVAVSPAKTIETNQNTSQAANGASPDKSSTSATSPTISPSFDCEKATTTTEKLICSNNDLAQADVQLAQTYKASLSIASDKTAMKREQAAWLKNQRDVCKDAKTMLQVYQVRISQLSK